MAPIRQSFVVVLALSSPLSVWAQTPASPLTRAQAIQKLVDLENTGYRPAQASSLRFPFDIEAAEQRLAEKASVQPPASESIRSSEARQ
jgi:hypothetical protein